MNKRYTLFSILFAFALSASAGAQAAGAGASECVVGPTEKMFGKSKWLLYGCNDAKTAVIVSAEGNPAAPFYFVVSREAETFRIYGEGAGNKNASGAALKELQSLGGEALAHLVKEANKSKR